MLSFLGVSGYYHHSSVLSYLYSQFRKNINIKVQRQVNRVIGDVRKLAAGEELNKRNSTLRKVMR